VWAIAGDSGGQVAEIERSHELGSSQGGSSSIGYSKSRRREVASSESAIGSCWSFSESESRVLGIASSEAAIEPKS
jgi:hypothetical protein